MSGKGSGRRPGEGYDSGWDRIFGKKEPKPVAAELICEACGADRTKTKCKAEHWQRCPMMGEAQEEKGV
jgi:hypothetical protein